MSITQKLEDATIVYLDDQVQSLNETVDTFSVRGIKLKATQSIDEAKSDALKNNVDILLCDLHLDYIESKFRGNNILRLIRTKRKDIFLALYTAYKRELSNDELEELAKNDIFIYDKEDNVEFILNLIYDYAKFKSKRSGNDASPSNFFDTNISNSVVDKVVKHLINVTNQELLVPVPGFEDITVKKLIEEIYNKTPRAEAYVNLWIETKLIIEGYKNV